MFMNNNFNNIAITIAMEYNVTICTIKNSKTNLIWWNTNDGAPPSSLLDLERVQLC
jgi:hypothetical protein